MVCWKLRNLLTARFSDKTYFLKIIFYYDVDMEKKTGLQRISLHIVGTLFVILGVFTPGWYQQETREKGGRKILISIHKGLWYYQNCTGNLGCSIYSFYDNYTETLSNDPKSDIGTGTDASDRFIIGGQNAGLAAWPWQVALLRRGRLICGGTLITTDSVLTAAHCVVGQSPDDLSVILGENNRYYTEGSEQKISVRTASVHPLFRNDYLGGYDIAFLYLYRNASVTSFVRPIPNLARRRSFDDSRIKCFITGWGVSSTGEITILVSMLITATQGDSGSPLVCKTRRGYTLVGITSWGSISCRNYPTVFTAVAKFRNWIETTLLEFRRSSFIRESIKDGAQIPQQEEKNV
ncbi:hypothetical protein FSP39_007108 [Pinctada imbricata]|uniref:Peptidase S1 domain-containing protein n=1 Tax=Pinctada imbricata TaxID=66713 RepID=A0AA89C8K0_PINIB|nr:hypothetical protein FSP39_007108 [Pinctada imbricata]